MKKIRLKVYETNSSSSHSIHISNEVAVYDSFTVPDDGVLTITGYSEFGWEIDDHSDPATKAIYAWLQAQYSGDDAFKHKKMVLDVIKAHTGAREVHIPYDPEADWDSPRQGYIDHQSTIYEDATMGDIFETPVALKNFIFNPESFLHTDNDNH